MSHTDPQGVEQALSREDLEDRLSDLHYAVLDRLPMQGAMLGWSDLAVTVAHLRDELNKQSPAEAPPLTSTLLQAEMRVMAQVGLIVRVQTLKGSTRGWQKTRRGADLLSRYKEKVQGLRDDQLPQPSEEDEQNDH